MLTSSQSLLARMQDRDPLLAYNFIENGHPMGTSIRTGTQNGTSI
jgi:hypothetical protein